MRRLARPLHLIALLGGGLLALAIGLPAATQPSVSPAPATTPAPKAPAKAAPVPSGPAWTELGRSQQAALAPLSNSWSGMTEAHKRKWIALSTNYARLEPAEQAKLHERMTEWAALSPQQRAQARLNFAETKELSAEQKKAKWEAYQALPDEQKRKLATQGKREPKGAAVALRPVAPQKLAAVPPVPPSTRHPARIATAPEAHKGAEPHENLLQTSTEAPAATGQ